VSQHETSNAAAAFAVVDKADWNARLARNDKGALLPVVDNVVAILLNDERWAGVIAFDQFSHVVQKRKPPPFERGEKGEWADIDDARLELWLAERYSLRRLGSDVLTKAVSLAADANRYHEVQDYLNGLEWDGKARLRYWLSAYLGAKRSEYVERVGIKWLVGAVARVMRPGCKMDNVVIFEGGQGIGKSTSLKVLFDPWFTDAAFEIGSTDGYQIIRGMWCVELAELDGFNRAEASRSKAFFTRQTDRYRNPYGRKPVNVPRQGVFAGSVNHATYLKDDTGNRRYWPVAIVGDVSLDELRADRDQLWAEAVHEYRSGTEWWVRAAERDIYEVEQDSRYIGDAYETTIRGWLNTPDAGGVKPDQVTVARLMSEALGLDKAKWTLPEQQRVGRIMARLGWPRRRMSGNGREWVYMRPEGEQ